MVLAEAKPKARVLRATPVGSDGDRIVLYSWSVDERPRIENLLRMARSGTIRWQATLPDGEDSDCFNRFRLEDDGTVRVWTYGGQIFSVDADTGNRLNEPQMA